MKNGLKWPKIDENGLILPARQSQQRNILSILGTGFIHLWPWSHLNSRKRRVKKLKNLRSPKQYRSDPILMRSRDWFSNLLPVRSSRSEWCEWRSSLTRGRQSGISGKWWFYLLGFPGFPGIWKKKKQKEGVVISPSSFWGTWCYSHTWSRCYSHTWSRCYKRPL